MSARAHDLHLSAMHIDALVVDGLSETDRRQALAHLDACVRCRQDVEAARAARRHFSDAVLGRSLPAIRRRLGGAPTQPRWSWLVGCAAAAAILLAVGGRLWRPAEPELSTKGGSPSLRLVARRAGQVFAVHEGTPLRAGDEIRFVVSDAERPYLLVASIDGDGHSSIYYPFDGEASTQVDGRGRRLELPGSITLDAARGPERIFALLTDAPLSSAAVKEALAKLATGGPDAIRAARRLPLDAAQLSIGFEKAPQ